MAKRGKGLTDTESSEAPAVLEMVRNGIIIHPTNDDRPSSYGVIRRDVRWFDLCEEMPGLQFKAWANPPRSLRRHLFDGTEETMRDALRKIFLEHNDWRYEDDEGVEQTLPAADDPEFWAVVPMNVSLALMRRLVDLTSALPNSLIREKSN